MVLLTMDRWLIAWQLSATSLGYYSIGVMASNLLALVPTSAANVLYPKMLEQFALTHNPSAVALYLFNPLRAIAALMVLLVGMSTIFIPEVIILLLPKYNSSIPLIEILIPGAYLLSFTHIAGNYVITINRQNLLVMIQLTSICIGLIVDATLIYYGYGIYGIAYGTICCYAIYGLGYFSIALYLAGEKPIKIILAITEILILFIFTIIGIAITKYYFITSLDWKIHLFKVVSKLIIYASVVLPVIWLINRKSGLLASTNATFFKSRY